MPARWVVAIGFGLFAAGAFGNAFQTPKTDFAGLLVPQILRGAALLFCIVPITNVALDDLPSEALANASGLLNDLNRYLAGEAPQMYRGGSAVVYASLQRVGLEGFAANPEPLAPSL